MYQDPGDAINAPSERRRTAGVQRMAKTVDQLGNLLKRLLQQQSDEEIYPGRGNHFGPSRSATAHLRSAQVEVVPRCYGVITKGPEEDTNFRGSRHSPKSSPEPGRGSV